MEKRTLIAFLLTAALWGVWFLIIKPDTQNVKKDETPGKSTVTEKADKTVGGDQSRKTDPGIIPVSKPVKALKKPDRAEEKTFAFNSEKFSFLMTNRGGAIKSLKLKERKDKDGSNLEIILNNTPYNSRNIIDFPIHFSEDEFMTGSEIDGVIWGHEKKSEKGITFFTDIMLNDTPVQIHKTYAFTEKGDDFAVEYRIINKGKKELFLDDKNIIFSSSDMLGPAIDFKNTYNQVSGIYSLNGSFVQESKGSGFFTKEGVIKKAQGNVAWVGLMSRYLLLIMMPESFQGSEVISDNRDKTAFRTGLAVKGANLKPDTDIIKKFRIYVGEKDKDRLRAISESIVDAADVSKWIEPIRYFVMWSLLGLNKIFGNMGWALVFFSIITKIVFMPLTNKSTNSMKKMQGLTPKINELKAKYKDKPDVIQKETMKLYKQEKVNPLGGCLPVVLQMPFFFGLYSALINSIDLWNAPFIFWIKDLSMPDTVGHISGFDINILPVLMTASTYLQQKMTTVEAGPQQKMMTMMMPAVFIFIFWSMPSGLVLYWTLQNVFQVAQQLYVTRNKNGQPKLEIVKQMLKKKKK